MKVKANGIDGVKKSISEAVKKRETIREKYRSEHETILKDIEKMSIEVSAALEGEDAEKYAIACDTLGKLKSKAEFYEKKLNSVNEGIDSSECDSLAKQLIDANNEYAEERNKKILSLAKEIVELSADITKMNTDSYKTLVEMCTIANKEPNSYRFESKGYTSFGVMLSREMYVKKLPYGIECYELMNNSVR